MLLAISSKYIIQFMLCIENLFISILTYVVSDGLGHMFEYARTRCSCNAS